MTLPPVKMTLTGLYFALLLYIGLDVYGSLRSGHKKKSFRMGFICMLGLWTLDRTIFWLIVSVVTVQSPFTQRFLFWMPLPLQAATFSFLLLYYAKIIYPTEWENGNKGFCKAVYGGSNFIVLAISTAWSLISIGPANGSVWADKVWLYFQATVFFLLSLAYCIAAFKLTRDDYQSVKQLPIRHATAVNVTIVICFLSRSIIDVMEGIMYDQSWRTKCCTLDYDHEKDLHYTAVFLYVVWELIPTVVTLIFVAEVGGNFGLGVLLTRGASTNNRFVYDPSTGEYIDTALSPRGSSFWDDDIDEDGIAVGDALDQYASDLLPGDFERERELKNSSDEDEVFDPLVY